MATSTMLDNGTKFDIASWTNWTAVNVTQYVPSARDFALAGPRMVMKLGSFLAVPESVDNILGIRMGARIIPEATGSGIPDPAETITAAAVAGIRQIVETSSETLTEENIMEGSRFSLESARSLGGLFAYATSKWALGCVVMAIVLNRTHIMASTRRPLEFTWKPRFLLRIIPIILLLIQARWLLQSIQCQTSPDFGYLRWGNSSKSHNLLFTQDGGPLHTFSQALLFGAKDSSSCLAVSMIPSNYTVGNETNSEGESPPHTICPGPYHFYGLYLKHLASVNLSKRCPALFKRITVFYCFCRQVAAETGMTLFEHSLAFAEADAAISAQIVGFTKIKIPAEDNSDAGPTQFAVTRSMIMKKINTTPEVLLVGFLSVMNHLSSHILAIFDIQGRFRLLSTGFWGISFMSVIVWSLVSFSFDHPSSQALLRFPTVCIIGFIPHVLVLCGIVICSIIYGVALILSTLAPASGIDESNVAVGQNLPGTPHPRLSFSQRVINAHHNMQANVPLSSIRITMHMDFYTALLRTGFAVMTMASEAVYLNESRGVNVKPNTWLEDDRLREIEETGAQWLGPSFKAHESELAIDDHMPHNVGLVAAPNQTVRPSKNNSPYGREMTAQKNAKSKGQERSVRDGVGATERSGRWVMALEFFLGINRLILSW
ncbi:ubiquitin-protein ligase [Botrytis cinerea]